MKILDLKTMQQCEISENTVVALGTFDGCHLGHTSVLSRAFLEAKRLKAKTVAYTFSTIPKNASAILTLDEKIRRIRNCHIDYVAIDEFESVKEKSGEEFVNEVLFGRLRAVYAVCGFNYRFGKGASCGAENLTEMLEKNGGSVAICDKVVYEDKTVSSTLIRELIQDGEVEAILPFSCPYSVYARVELGKQLGRTIGIPTINQIIPDQKIKPKRGVYITECEIGEDVYPSITNVGVRPTVESSGVENMETHIIGYDGILYSSYVRVNFYKRLRDEMTFDSLDSLKEQIALDISEAKKYFK